MPGGTGPTGQPTLWGYQAPPIEPPPGPDPATALAITAISPTTPQAGSPFSVTVEARAATGQPANVTADTVVTLSLAAGSGVLGGNVSGTIPAGSSSVTIGGVTYSVAEGGVQLLVTGGALAGASSWPVEVSPEPVPEPPDEPTVDGSLGYPDVYLAGANICDRVLSVRWSHGRDWWLSAPEPGLATLELDGTTESRQLVRRTFDADSGAEWTMEAGLGSLGFEEGAGGIPSSGAGRFAVMLYDAAQVYGHMTDTRRFALVPGELLTVTFRGYVAGPPSVTMHVAIAIRRSDGSFAGYLEPSPLDAVAGSAGWTTATYQLTVPPDVTSGAVTVVMYGDLGSWAAVDEITVRAGSSLAAIELGDTVAIAAEPAGQLWHGWVDGIDYHLEPADGEVRTTIRVTAVDQLSRILTAEVYRSVVLQAGDLEARLLALAQYAGVPPRAVRHAPSAGVLPQLATVTLAGSASKPVKLAEHLAACELASNAIVAVAPDGAWLILARDALPSTPAVVDLVGDSCPSSADVATTTPDRVRNAFTIADGAEVVRQASIDRYGRRAFDVPAGVTAAGVTPPYTASFFDALADPAPFVRVTVPVAARSARAVPLAPFAFVRLPDRAELYQLLGLTWQATPGAWEVHLELDRTQTSIAATPAPELPPVTPPPPPATTRTVTTTFACERSAYVVNATGGIAAGNGGSVDLLVGLLGDGQLARGLVRFPLAWAGKVRQVKSAKLRLRVGQTTCSSYGSSPRITAYRAGSTWLEGTYSTRCAFASSNAVKWPGPTQFSTGAASGSPARTEGALLELDVTAIVAAWASGAPNYGFVLRGASESNSANRCPFWSRNASSSTMRPTLVVTYEHEV
jgi:hypothetical protein